MKKYELTDGKIRFLNGKKLSRIKAIIDIGDTVKVGDLGGYVESEDNLSHEGTAWIFWHARVFGDAYVYGNAKVSDNARVYGSVKVFDNAEISGNAIVCGDVTVFGNAKICWIQQIRLKAIFQSTTVR